VQSCPNAAIAIDVVAVTGLVGDPNQRIAPGAPLSTITRPTTRFVSARREAANGGRVDPFGGTCSQDETVDQVAESHWPLALMLVASQVSVGMLWAERLAASVGWLEGNSMPLTATGANAIVAFLIGALGMAIAPLHLGQPMRAWRVFLGLRTSWLSREAVVLGKYMGSLALATLLLWQSSWIQWVPESAAQWIPSWAAKSLLSMAMLLGFAGLYSSAMIYIATRRSLWRHYRTFVRFFGTAIASGAAFTSVPMLVGGASEKLAAMTLMTAFMVLACKLIWEWLTLLGDRSDVDLSLDQRARRLVNTRLLGFKNLRLASGMVSLGLMLLGILSIFADVSSAAVVFAAAGSASMIVGEFAERLLYFQSVVYERMPGTLP
jgi:DMSO reductase anchor subunit